MKILNLYACLGGNRFLWGDEHEITSVELDPELARMYQERFAECIGIVKHTPCVTIMQVANELQVNHSKDKYLLDQLEDCNLIVNFGYFYASTDLIDLN